MRKATVSVQYTAGEHVGHHHQDPSRHLEGHHPQDGLANFLKDFSAPNAVQKTGATHGERFIALLQRHYPTWREARAELNELPLAPYR